MTNVYPWPSNVGGSTLYTPPTRIRATEQWDGAPGQKVEQGQRSRVEISGEVVRTIAPDFDIMLDRLRGGIHLVGLWDMELRAQNGWDLEPALNSSGAEFWRADGNTSIYAGESDNAPTGPWRTVDATSNGVAALGAVSLPVTGLLANEVIPKGTMISTADFRHRTLSASTADASGIATVAISSPLRAATTNGQIITIPGDFFVGRLVGREELSPADVDGVRSFKVTFIEVYSAEVTGGFVYTVD